jgi:hypothetical protein
MADTMLKSLKQVKRSIVAVIGFTILGIGIAMIVLPGPAILVIPLGLSILATEFAWAKRFLEKMKDRLKKTYTKPMERRDQLQAGEIRSNYGHKKREERRRNMKKLIIGGGIIGIIGILIIWALAAGAGYLSERLPLWAGDGGKLVREAILRAEQVLPGVREGLERVAPGLTGKIKEIIPDMDVPEKDVGGEDIRPIPRHADMIRISYALNNQKKTVSYKGKMSLRAASDFYKKEMVALGFKEKVVTASSEQEVYQYRKGVQELEFRFKKIPTVRLEITELTVKEL